MDNELPLSTVPIDSVHWKTVIRKYQKPSLMRAIGQITDSFGLYFALWYLSYRLMAYSYWAALPVVILAGGILARVFIIFHDCGHGSFFKSRLANDICGFFAGVLVFTPYFNWRWEHSIHHASSGNLDRRGTGDLWTLTVDEFRSSSRWTRLGYRLVRNPFVLFLIIPSLIFFLEARFPAMKNAKPREKRSVYWTNLAIAALAGIVIYFFGIESYLLIHLPTMAVAATVAVWMFYVQHQFDEGYFERKENWDFTKAALQGSSYYRLPVVLQWFTGNIGFHHIHHLSARIPNYNLERCHNELGLSYSIVPLTLSTALRSIPYRLWDESHKRFIGYAQLRQIIRDEMLPRI